MGRVHFDPVGHCHLFSFDGHRFVVVVPRSTCVALVCCSNNRSSRSRCARPRQFARERSGYFATRRCWRPFDRGSFCWSLSTQQRFERDHRVQLTTDLRPSTRSMLTNVAQSFVEGHSRNLTNRYGQSSGSTNSARAMNND